MEGEAMSGVGRVSRLQRVEPPRSGGRDGRVVPTARMRRFFGLFVTLLLLSSLLPAITPTVGAVSTDVVISQVYGGGGNSGAPYRNDFIELFNRGTTTVNLSGYSVQYNTAAGTSDYLVTALSGSIASGKYFLIQEAAGANASTPSLPTPDMIASPGIAMSAANGRVVLVNSTTALPATPCPAGAGIIDAVSYGPTTTCSEGTATPALSNSTAAIRGNGGCTDTDSNNGDFSVAAPNPRNSAVTAAPCSAQADTPPTVTGTTPANAGSIAPGANIAITFSEAVTITGEPFALSCNSVAQTVARTGGPTTFTLDPSVDLVDGAACTVTISASGVADQDGTIQQLAADYRFSFTVVTPTAGAKRIRDIQGAAHLSPLSGMAVMNVPGVVTARRANGFYMQDVTPDSDPATSEGIFVFTSSAPPVAATVGHGVLVSGTVSEFRPGGTAATNAGLTTTQIGGTPTIAVVSTGNALPAATVIGAGGRVPPTTIIEDDATGTPPNVETSGTFDPATDGLDFYESLEGMLVQVNNAVAVGPTSDFGSNREIPVLPDGGTGFGPRTPRGGIVITPTDFNPERIFLNDLITGVTPLPTLNVGDGLGTVVGVIDYGFSNFKLEVTALPTRINNGLVPEVTSIVHETNGLTIATFNVENLDSLDPPAKFAALAGIIVANLRAPDIIALEEVQDNDGPANNANVSASQTYATLIAAITDAGGPTYQYRQIDPVDDQDGGEPGGNIRVGFLFRTDRGVTFVDRAGGCSTCAVGVMGTGNGLQLTQSPGRIEPTNAAFNNSRKPLAGEFRFNGRQLFLIANHFNSKGGDQPLFGRYQPPARSSETQRAEQARIVHDFVQNILTADANANVVVLGDINDFQFSGTLDILKAGVGGATPILADLIDTLPIGEQYTYVFQGNSQALDHILVSANLVTNAAVAYDVVHANAEFADQVSDHDPQVARLILAPPPPPTAGALAISTLEDVSITITLAGTASNGQALTYSVVTGPAHGSVGAISGNQVTYSPAANYNGPDSFTYRVTQEGRDSPTATVAITVGAVNDPPIAANVGVSTPEDTGIEITLSATDAEGAPLTYTIVVGPAHGVLGALNGNKVVYIPTGEYSGPDAFTFRANDGTADSNVATVGIAVTVVNDPPIALNGTATVAEDGSVVITLVGTDVEGAILTYSVVNTPAHGSVGAVGGNTVTYTPAANFNGTDSFTFRANDGAVNSTLAVVTITVTPVNDPPTASDSAATTGGGVAVQIVLGASDPEGDALTYAIVAGPTHGTLGPVGGNRVVYTPAAGYSGPDAFTFRASDGDVGSSNVATVSLTVSSPAPAPTVTLTVTTVGNGTATPGTGSFVAGTTATLTATAGAGAVFTGWMVDGAFAGFGNPLAVAMNANHTVSASFAARPTFGDVSTGTPYSEAIARLAARGIIRGFGDGTLGPTQPVKRAESAALIARALGWEAEAHGNAFSDRCDPVNGGDCIDADLWRNVGTLAFYNVARGFGDGTYRPRDEVAHVQVISFITRAMVAKGYWIQARADDPSIYPNIDAASGHRLDLVTFVGYAGTIPDRPATQDWADAEAAASRSWFAGLLDQALRSRFATTP